MKLCALALSLIPAAATAQTSQDYAAMSRTMWAAFQCGYYAESMDNAAEVERLYNLGIEKGRSFLVALEAGQIDQADLYRTIPMGVSVVLGGPSHDFIIGRVFENAMRDAADRLYVDGDFNGALRRSKAEVAFQDGNCALIR